MSQHDILKFTANAGDVVTVHFTEPDRSLGVQLWLVADVDYATFQTNLAAGNSAPIVEAKNATTAKSPHTS